MSTLSTIKPAGGAAAVMTLAEIYEELLTLESMALILAVNLDAREDETVHLARQLHVMRKTLRRVYEAVDEHQNSVSASHD